MLRDLRWISSAPLPLTPADLLAVQRTLGNQAALAMHSRLLPAPLQRDITLKNDTRPGPDNTRVKVTDAKMTPGDALHRIAASRDGGRLVETYGLDAVRNMFMAKVDGNTFTNFDQMLKTLSKALLDAKTPALTTTTTTRASPNVNQVSTPLPSATQSVPAQTPTAASSSASTSSENKFKRQQEQQVFIDQLEEKLADHDDVSVDDLREYVQVSDKKGDRFWNKVAKTILAKLPKDSPPLLITDTMIERAEQSVRSSKAGMSLIKLTPLNQPMEANEIQQRKETLDFELDKIATHAFAAAAFNFLANDPKTVEMDALVNMMVKALRSINGEWAKIKPAGQTKLLSMIISINDIGDAKGAAGELSGVAYTLPRSLRLNVGKDKQKYFGQPVPQGERPEQDIDVSSTRRTATGDVRVYTESKYDMETFLAKAIDLIDVLTGSGTQQVPKQLHMYGVTARRTKTRPARTPLKQLELYISNPHDWLVLFLPQRRALCEYLLNIGWRLIIGSDEVPPDRIRALMAWTEVEARKLRKDKERKAWALRLSQQFGPLNLQLT